MYETPQASAYSSPIKQRLVKLGGLLSNPQVDHREFSQDLDPIPRDPFLELVAAISRPAFISRAEKLIGLTEKFRRSDKKTVPTRKPKPRQEQILQTIKLVLPENPDGLHTYEVRKPVETRLGRELPKSTVKGALASNDTFERIGYGRYRYSPL